MMYNNKYFIITIDTEGDNLWAVSDIDSKISTDNADYLWRFQEICEQYGYISTYLTNYEMAYDKRMIDFGKEGLKKKTLEIGTHEHSWNQPPYYHLRKRVGKKGKPFLYEYPKLIIKEKLKRLTYTLEDTFGKKMLSHRGGRWALNPDIVDILEELGYRVDCTCTPGINWSDNLGWTYKSKGPDWSQVPNDTFYLKKSCGDESSVVEVPVTILDQKGSGIYSWLRPNLSNEYEMLSLVNKACELDLKFIEFMIHSSELMPGGSPIFDKKWKVEKLYYEINMLFEEIKKRGFVGVSLSDYSEIVRKEMTGGV